MEMIENQVYLAQENYAKVIALSEKMLAVCEGMHYALVALHIRIQAAVAYEMLGKAEEAHVLLARALSDAGPDGLVMPFVENYDNNACAGNQDGFDCEDHGTGGSSKPAKSGKFPSCRF